MEPSASFRDLCRLFASIKTEREAALLLKDLLTPQELESLNERWLLIRELSKGTPQREIARKLHLSISKITRGSHALQYGQGGFERFLQKTARKKALARR